MGKLKNYAKQAKAVEKLYSDNKLVTRVIPMSRKEDLTHVSERIALRVGEHQFPLFKDLLEYPSGSAYPKLETIPKEFCDRNNRFSKIVSSLYFNSGAITDFGLKLKYPTFVDETVYRLSVNCTIQALMQSYGDRAPSHDRKLATIAWCISEWYEDDND